MVNSKQTSAKYSRPGRSTQQAGGCVKVFLFIWGVGFVSGGAFCFWTMVLSPAMKKTASEGWPQIDCIIASSKVEESQGEDGSTYKVAITFSYEFEGKEHEGGSYDFVSVGSSERHEKAAIVERYPVEFKTTCWVNPDDPQEAVLSRGLPEDFYFMILFTSVFMIPGMVAIFYALGLYPSSWKKSQESIQAFADQVSVGRTTLNPDATPAKTLFIAIAICFFWNGVVSIFVTQAVQGFLRGDPEWFLTIFMIPFVLIGTFLFVWVVHSFLALFNPKPVLTLDEGSPRLGDTIHLDWDIVGAISRLSKLTITFQAHEKATYRRGTTTTTDESLFYQHVVFETTRAMTARRGDAQIAIPADSMHTFDSGNNKIVWSLKFHGDIKRWPDVSHEYPINVRPLEVESA